MISEHFRTDRADRYAFIATTLGIGEVIHSHKQLYNKYGTEPCTVYITTTGVAIVKNPKGTIVTMYVLTLNEARKYFNVIPFLLESIIKTNMKKKYHLLQNDITY
jgi:hypothetical protein